MLNRVVSFLRSSGPVRAVSNYFRPNGRHTRAHRIFTVVLFACMSVVIMGDNGCVTCLLISAMSGAPYDLQWDPSNRLGPNVKPTAHPRLTGSDGSSTGLASFAGNFTAITQPSQTYFAMQRQADCSLKLITGTSSLNGKAAFASEVSNYERTLHQLASLTTTADVYPHSCVASYSAGSRIGVWVGVTTQNYGVFATAAGNGSNNAVFTLVGNPAITSFNLVSQTPLVSASAVATADLNGDGNGDLVVVNGYNPANGFIDVMYGNSDGTFQTPIKYTTAGSMSVTAVIDDVDGDGHPDIIVASDDQQISVLTGKSDGTFNSPQNFSAPLPGSASPSSTPILNMITADVNGDKNKDIVCSNGLVLLGKGDGTFTAQTATAFPYTVSTSSVGPNLAAGDFNNDGKLDLVLSNGRTVSTWLGKVTVRSHRARAMRASTTRAMSRLAISMATATLTSMSD